MTVQEPPNTIVVSGLTVTFEDSTADEAFRRRVARPGESDPAYAQWLLKSVPKGAPRSVAVYLHGAVGDRCGICGTAVDISLRHPHPASAQVDHITPREAEGADVWGNVRLAHRQCNMERNSGEISADKARTLLAEAIHLIDHPEGRIPRDIRRLREALAQIPAEIESALQEYDHARARGAGPGVTGPLRRRVQELEFRRENIYPRKIAELSAEFSPTQHELLDGDSPDSKR